ncbi:LLM class flavin-dependent oxidoreductase [Allobranchiibius sp. CTAmp26]|uniref:LLM class flavin-dependent oxidoreductase n=1 Tax=Allobranchiibius sp. CTAmp26 TaxID=2815214 RepID=UPI001AA0E686|nr:LLM class flavin-dependent oxidoreductase [Allobranchiibius sp. CTAmp26]MBO1754644.1 LLM class flavin-dependent oxidoreductase [Allobranchiibius sp. CTAmp26]
MTDAQTDVTGPIRFGVVAPIADLGTWRDQIRRVADLGYSTLLLPDVPGWQPAPGPTLAVAASLTDLHVGTWVYATALRPASMTVWEAHSLTELTDGRFELGLGTGRPGIEDLAAELGLPPTTPGQRVDRMRDTVTALRKLDGPDRHTPVVMAVRGPRTRALAVELADTVTIASLPGDTRDDVKELVRDLRATRDIPLALHVSVVGDTVAPYMAGPGADPAAMRAADSLAILPADPSAALEELHRRREEIGFSVVVIGSNSVETLAPVVSQLAGN